MEKIIEFKNLNFGYDSNHTFKDFNMSIEEKDIITLIGPGTSGKTTLLKLLCNKISTDTLYYKGKNTKKIDATKLQTEIVVIFDSPTTESYARDEITKFVRKLHISENEINQRIKKLNKFFPLKSFFDKKIYTLKKEQVELIKILRYLIISPKFLAIDCALGNLSLLDKRLFFEYIKKEEITLLNVTTDLNDGLYGNQIYVLDNFNLILQGPTFSIMKTDTILKRLGFRLPLAVNLSLCLNNYNVLKKVYKDNEKLVNALWK